MISSDAEFQAIELRVILGKPEPTTAPLIVLEPRSIIDELVVPVVYPEVGDGDDEDVEDGEEPEKMDEDIMEKDDPEEDIVAILLEGVIEEGRVVEDIVKIILGPHGEIA